MVKPAMALNVPNNINGKRIRWFILFLILPAVANVGSCRSRGAAGSYRWTQTGQFRLGGISALSDLQPWSPEGCWWQPGFKSISGKLATRSNNLGKFYAPLMTLDREFNFPDSSVHLAEEFLKASHFQ